MLNISLHQGNGYLHGSLTSNLLLTPLVALLLCHIAQTIRTRSPLFAMALWSMIAFAAFAMLIKSGMHASDMVRVATIASTSASLVALLPLRKEASGNVVGVYRTAFSNFSLQHSFLVPLHAVSTAIALCLISAVLIPAVLITNASLRSVVQPEVIAWVLTWLVGWKLIFNNRLVGIITTGVTPLLVSAMVISSGVLSVTYSTLPLIWTATAVVNYAAAFDRTHYALHLPRVLPSFGSMSALY